jgi:transcriptional regulator with XRE-family HTH domain
VKSFTLFKQPKDIKLEIARRLKSIRKINGYTQQELAERSWVSLGSIKRFEQTGEISLHHLLQLAQILDVMEDFDLLFQQKEDEISDAVRKSFE